MSHSSGSEPGSLWYVGYGSNLALPSLLQYLDLTSSDRLDEVRDEGDGRPARWVTLTHPLYFAGTSKNWGGAVAFLGLQPSRRAVTTGRAYLVSAGEFSRIVMGENGAHVRLPPLDGRGIGDAVELPVIEDEAGYGGKYNVLLRLPDIDGVAAYTLTTNRLLRLGLPSPIYRARIADALAGHRPVDEVEQYLTAAAVDHGDNARYLTSPRPGAVSDFAWNGRVEGRLASGIDVIDAPERGRPADAGLVLGTVSDGECAVVAWVGFGEAAAASERLAGRFLRDAPLQVTVTGLERFIRTPGDPLDLQGTDVAQLCLEDAERLGRWILVITPLVTAAMRVSPRAQVEQGTIRLAYAARAALSLREDDPVLVQRLDGSERRASPVGRAWRAVTEHLVGAPVLALRATEGMIGDESLPVVRVDPTALDYLGVASGGRVVISWADRSARAQVLLQSDVTREWMDQQLAGRTGFSARRDTAPAARARLTVPPHLRAWVSPSLRYRLDIPDDTLVRVRRSVRGLVATQASLLVLPVAALVVGVLALPGVVDTVGVPGLVATLLVGLVLLVALTFLPVRRPHRAAARGAKRVRR